MYLGIDTTNNNLCYGLLDTNKDILFSENIYPCKNAAEILAPKIHALFSDFSINIYDIKAIISVNGPGGFSGVRIGTSFITGLTIHYNIPIIGISSLQALALSVDKPQKNSIIISCLDARRQSVYLSIYQDDYTPLISEQLIQCDEVKKTLKKFDKQFYYLYGHGFNIIRPFLNPQYMLNDDRDCENDFLHYPKAELFIKNASLLKNTSNNKPLYLRQPDAKLPKNKTNLSIL